MSGTQIEDTEQVLVDMAHTIQALEHEIKFLKDQLKWTKRRADQQSKELIGTMARLNKLEQWQLLQGSKAQ